MTGKNQRLKGIFTLVLISTFFINGLAVRAQDVVTSEDFTGGSSAFVFKTSRKPTQKKIVFRTAVNFSRTKAAKLETIKRVAKQTITIAKTAPKRTKLKVVTPEVANNYSIDLQRKSPQEAAVVFAGVGEYYINRDNLDESVRWFRQAVELDPKNVNAKNGLSDALTLKGNQVLTLEDYDIAKLLYDEALQNNPKNAGALAGLAEIYSAKDDRENAIASYEKALAYDAEMTELLAPLGVLYFQKGEAKQDAALLQKSETLLQRAIAVNSDNAE